MANSFDAGSVTATVTADTKPFVKGIEDAQKKVTDFKGNLENIGKGIQDFANKATLFTGVVTAGLVLLGKQSVDAFTEADKEMAIVNQALLNVADEINNVTDASKENSAEVKKANKMYEDLTETTAQVSEAYIQLGFDDENTAKAFSKSLQVTKDVTQSKKDLILAADFARLKNIDLATSVDILQMAYMGNAKALKSYGINVKDLANKQEIQAVIQEKAGGQARAFAETYAGKLAKLNVEVGNLYETMGEFLVNALIPIVDWFSKLAESEAVYNTIYKIAGVFQSIYDILADGKISVALQNILGAQIATPLVGFLMALHNAFIAFGAWISENQGLVTSFLQAVAMTITSLLVIGTVNALLTALLNPFNLIIMALTLLYFAWNTNFMGIQNIVSTVITAIVDFFNNYLMPAFMALSAFITANSDEIMLVIQVSWNLIKDIFFVVTGLIYELIVGWGTKLIAFLTFLWEKNKNDIIAFWNIIKGVFEVAIAVLSAILAVFVALVTRDWDTMWSKLLQAGVLFWNGLQSIFNGIISFITGWGHSLYDRLVQPFVDAWNKISELVKKIQDALDFTKRHSPSVLDTVKRGVGLVNNALGDLAINAMSNPTNIGGEVTNMAQSLGIASINIDLSGAYIGSEMEATAMGERIGDSIIQKLKNSVRF